MITFSCRCLYLNIYWLSPMGLHLNVDWQGLVGIAVAALAREAEWWNVGSFGQRGKEHVILMWEALNSYPVTNNFKLTWQCCIMTTFIQSAVSNSSMMWRHANSICTIHLCIWPCRCLMSCQWHCWTMAIASVLYAVYCERFNCREARRLWKVASLICWNEWVGYIMESWMKRDCIWSILLWI